MGNKNDLIETKECEIFNHGKLINFKNYHIFECKDQKLLIVPKETNIKSIYEAPIQGFNNRIYSLNKLNSKFYYVLPRKGSNFLKFNEFCGETFFKEFFVMCNKKTILIYNRNDKTYLEYEERDKIFDYELLSENQIWFATTNSLKLWDGKNIINEIKLNYPNKNGYKVFFKVFDKKIFYQVPDKRKVSIYNMESGKLELEFKEEFIFDNIFETDDYYIGSFNSEVVFYSKKMERLKKVFGSHLIQLQDKRVCYYDIISKEIIIIPYKMRNTQPKTIKLSEEVPLGLTQLSDGRILSFGLKRLHIWNEYFLNVPNIDYYKDFLFKDVCFDVRFFHELM